MTPRRGPRIRTRLLLLSLVLLALPWLGYRYLEEMQNFLLAGQEKAQALSARAIATVLHEREDLFYTVHADPRSTRADSSFYAFPLENPIQIDGYDEDWQGLLGYARHYGRAAMQEGAQASLEFDLLLGIREEWLHILIDARDDRIVYRHPGFRRLDNSDALRISFIDDQGDTRRLLVLTEGPGTTSAYFMQEHWKYALDGRPLPEVRGYWQPTADGYRLELRLPAAWLGPQRRLHIALADVDDAVTREVSAVVGTLPVEEDAYNHLVLRSAELERILSGLARSDARIWILDRQRRVRAQVGNLRDNALRDLARETQQRDEASVRQALAGTPALQRRSTLDGEGEMIMATHPILTGDRVLGAVVVEQSTQDILALQRQALEQVVLITLAILGVIIGGLMLFASRLALRIRRLSGEAHAAIGADGRVRYSELHHERTAGDEIGDLSCTISDLLQRLSRYTRFLENMPRMLRHEINNPLNTISTSLQNLSEPADTADQARYRDSARRGVDRIGAIVQSLTEAASLEEALRHEEREPVDLGDLLTHYTESCRLQHADHAFELSLPEEPAQVLANDFRMEQLLDKLIANAVDFSAAGTVIALDLRREGRGLCLEVRNEGRPLPEGLEEQLFDSLVSRREAPARDGHHLGMGLYVVRLIAEHAGGQVEAVNVREPDGVAVRVWLPASG